MIRNLVVAAVIGVTVVPLAVKLALIASETRTGSLLVAVPLAALACFEMVASR